MKTCPVLEFRDGESELNSVLRWFRWTYRLETIPMVGVQWTRDSWPAAGGAGGQDAWLTAALEIVADVYNAMVREQSKKHRKGKADEYDDE